MPWREAARADIATLKPHWRDKYGWQPEWVENGEAADLFVRLHGRRLAEKEYLLRLRYLPDWQTAGRREAFVNPADRAQEGPEFWPPEGAVRGLNPNHRPQGPQGPLIPCICLRGVYGYHSVLHANERPDGTSVTGFLLELQAVIDE